MAGLRMKPLNTAEKHLQSAEIAEIFEGTLQIYMTPTTYFLLQSVLNLL